MDPSAEPPARALGASIDWRGVASLAAVVVLSWSGMQLWRGVVDRDLGQDLAQAVKPGDLRLISSQTCVYCDQARAWLTTHQVPFQECLIEQDAACLVEFNRLGAPGTPTVMVRGQRQVGFDQRRILRAVESQSAQAQRL